jgi:hypothetical protein
VIEIRDVVFGAKTGRRRNEKNAAHDFELISKFLPHLSPKVDAMNTIMKDYMQTISADTIVFSRKKIISAK